MKYKAIKENWMHYEDAFKKYIKQGDLNAFIKNVPSFYKCKIDRIWFVDVKWLKSYLKKENKRKKNMMDLINRLNNKKNLEENIEDLNINTNGG